MDLTTQPLSCDSRMLLSGTYSVGNQCVSTLGTYLYASTRIAYNNLLALRSVEMFKYVQYMLWKSWARRYSKTRSSNRPSTTCKAKQAQCVRPTCVLLIRSTLPQMCPLNIAPISFDMHSSSCSAGPDQRVLWRNAGLVPALKSMLSSPLVCETAVAVHENNWVRTGGTARKGDRVCKFLATITEIILRYFVLPGTAPDSAASIWVPIYIISGPTILILSSQS